MLKMNRTDKAPVKPMQNYAEIFEKLFRFDDKVAIVAGGCGGIGSVISNCLAHLGATVVIADHREAQACECAEEIIRQGFPSHAIGFEITKPESIVEMVDGGVTASQ
jgi:NAD(P)-dependent dehydrogenase (short-subunit alcohol dehydrogenase family)